MRRAKDNLKVQRNIILFLMIVLTIFILFGEKNYFEEKKIATPDNLVIASTPSVLNERVAPSNFCGDAKCIGTESCSSCAQDCGQCVQEYSFTSYHNEEPYYSAYCDKINPYNIDVRTAAAKAIKSNPGEYNVNQLFDIYDWVKNNVAYQTVPLAGIAYPPEETLSTQSGDCKNQAVLIASMVGSIGGNAKVVLDPSCEHAYTIVRFGDASADISWFTKAVSEHYGSNIQVNYFENDNGIWVIFDPAGGKQPGNTLEKCSGQRTVYFVDSCLSCAQQYKNMPFTLGDKCYSQCPQGTISKNDFSCSPCNPGEWSYDNECVTCQKGYELYTDGRCHQI